MSGTSDPTSYWRVGYHVDPLGFTPSELYAFNHRFDDPHGRFRTLYVAEFAETCLREVLADFRINRAALRRHVEKYGPEAAGDIESQPVTAAWRAQHVLAPLTLELDGPMIDLTDQATRHALEERHHVLLLEHDMDHLDLHEITTSRRIITQTIAADLYDTGVAAVRFASRLDANVCVALFEGRGHPVLERDVVPLTDPAPEALAKVAAAWGLQLEPAAPVVARHDT